VIIKDRKIPLKVQKLEALLRRLPSAHPKRKEIEDDLAKSLAGYRGEQSLDYYFSFLPHKKYFIFHDLRLMNQTHYFQLDTLILSSCFFLIIEVKNFSGTLFFDTSFHQLIRTVNGKEEAFPNPVMQGKRQQIQLSTWLKHHKCPPVPVEFLVVISNPYTLIKTDNSRISQKVTHSANLLSKVEAFENLHKEEKLTEKELRRISRLLIKYHTTYNPDILQYFHIHEADLLTGVRCSDCFSMPMNRKWGKWICPNCFFSSKDAHISALHDYFFLLGSTITNQQFCNFLQLSSRQAATKMLAAMNLSHSGTTKGRAYHLSFDE
jgi:hypothetical protein